MQEKKYVKVFRTAKIIQLCMLLLFQLGFLLVLFLNPQIGREIYDNATLFLLCSLAWVLMLFNLFWLLFDFFQLRSFAIESHALNKAAYLDNLTGIPNRHGLDVLFCTYDTPESISQAGCFMCTIGNLQSVNETLGHKAGDLMIQNFCSIFEKAGDRFGVVGRNGGNEFVLVIRHCSHETMKQFDRFLNQQILEYNQEHPKAPMIIRSTYLLNAEEHAEAFTLLLTATYNKLHSPA